MKGSFIRKAVLPAELCLDGFRWVALVGAGSREKRVARCGVD